MSKKEKAEHKLQVLQAAADACRLDRQLATGGYPTDWAARVEAERAWLDLAGASAGYQPTRGREATVKGSVSARPWRYLWALAGLQAGITVTGLSGLAYLVTQPLPAQPDAESAADGAAAAGPAAGPGGGAGGRPPAAAPRPPPPRGRGPGGPRPPGPRPAAAAGGGVAVAPGAAEP
jgi:hypothetical protein